MKNFYLPLPEAERVPVPTTALARTAIDWKDQARKARQVAVAEYAIEVAGTGSDLDQDLESAGIEHLLKPTSPVTR